MNIVSVTGSGGDFIFVKLRFNRVRQLVVI